MTDFKVVIPARYGSSRLPAKPLMDIAGKPMVVHVYERALLSKAKTVVVATDDERIAQALKPYGAKVVMTSPNHPSGTDRLQEVAAKMRWDDDDIIVNVQGDEPLIPPEVINQVAANLANNRQAGIATLAEAIEDVGQLTNPNIVKLVRDANNMAMYFSRAPMPWARDAFTQGIKELPVKDLYWRHLGIYAYKVSFLNAYVKWSPAVLEQVEALEQLRALYYGVKIHVDKACVSLPAGVDTQEDLERVRAIVAAQKAAQAPKVVEKNPNADKINVLFVCLGNICRSPTAEGVFKTMVEKSGWKDLFNIDSAGTAAYYVGEPPDKRAQKHAKARGYDLSKLRARFISPQDFKKFDHILVMDKKNFAEMEKVQKYCKDPKAKLQLFLDYHPSQQQGLEVPDPYNGSDSGFEIVLDLVEPAAENLLKTLLQNKGLT
ncbi:MAG TPA: 3-deoxy-manno-octulosonate cytidylyltransferase, partial [Agitococcus sp.]|nr:3-deoxy-manno-octulosonate cytidylyltransferase [Agitococcus sp.]